jgi:hypothetical protein
MIRSAPRSTVSQTSPTLPVHSSVPASGTHGTRSTMAMKKR